MPLWSAAALSAIVSSLLSSILTLAKIEEPWNIVVVSEALVLVRLTFIVALAHVFVFGLPLFLLLRSMHRVRVTTCALAGFLVGAVPFGLLGLVYLFGVDNASTGGRATVVDRVPTLAGWLEWAETAGLCGLFGLAGGLTFWVAMRLSGQNSQELIGPEAQSSKSHAASWSIVSLAVLSTGVVFLLPGVAKDNSCHNLFRDGQRSLNPQIYADIKLTAEDWPTLKQIFEEFGAAYSLSFRNDELIRDGDVTWRDLNLCNEAGINIDAIDRPWLAHTNSPVADRGISLSVFELRAGSGWEPLVEDLLDRIETTWRHKITFRGPDGHVMAMKEALKGRH